MRNVLRNSSEVFHYWANEVQERGKAGSVSFEGGEVYSYAACIGNLVHRDNEGSTEAPFIIVLTADRTWSMTTSGHQSKMRQAADHFKQVPVQNPRPRTANDHRLNLDHIANRIEESIDKAKRARQNKAWHEAEALRRVGDFNLYAAFFGLEARFEGVGDVAGYLAKAGERKAAEDAAFARRQAELAAEREARLQPAVERWRKHERPEAYLYALSRPALRVSKDGQRIETTMGAEIPVKHALRLWTLVKLARARGGYVPGTESSVSLGVYQLTHISPQGDVIAGCHDIAYAEIERIARDLGLLEEVAA